MKRLMTYHPPRVEDVIQTFPTADRLGAFLFRRLQETPLPYLTLPYLVYGSTDHEAPPDCPVHEFAVELRPRVTPVPCVGEDGFQLRVVAPRTRTPEEGQPGEWSVRDEDYEVVEAEQFRVRRLARAFQARCDGVEELRIELWPSKLFGVLGDDDEPLAHYEPDPPLYSIPYEGRAVVPVRYDWLRLSLQDPAKLIDEESELATIAAFTDID